MNIRNYISVFVVLFFLNSCEKDDEAINYRDIVGSYTLIQYSKIERVITETSRSDQFTNLKNMCNRKSTLEVRSNGTFTKTDYSLDNEICHQLLAQDGKWSKKYSNYGNFVGEFITNDTNEIFQVYGFGKSSADGSATTLEFDLGSILDEDRTVYKTTYAKISVLDLYPNLFFNHPSY